MRCSARLLPSRRVPHPTCAVPARQMREEKKSERRAGGNAWITDSQLLRESVKETAWALADGRWVYSHHRLAMQAAARSGRPWRRWQGRHARRRSGSRAGLLDRGWGHVVPCPHHAACFPQLVAARRSCLWRAAALLVATISRCPGTDCEQASGSFAHRHPPTAAACLRLLGAARSHRSACLGNAPPSCRAFEPLQAAERG